MHPTKTKTTVRYWLVKVLRFSSFST